MPAFVPPVTDERSSLLSFLDAQREALIASVKGLSELQARQIPSASTMSLATVIHHVARVERRWTEIAVAGRNVPEIWPVTDFGADFRLSPEIRVSTVVDGYRAVGAETADIVSAVPDLGQPCVEPDSAQRSVRWVLLHLIAETARHAGHADIIRESIDGASAAMLRGASGS